MKTLWATRNETLSWKRSFVWLVMAVAGFQLAYSLKHPAAGVCIFGYVCGLIQLTDQPTIRRAFYFGLATAFLGYAPQLFFFYHIFSFAAIVLWIVLAFWVGLFSAIVWAGSRRWGRAKTFWLIPILWTGIEFFRSELYFLKFSWLNVGYVLSSVSARLGMYGAVFLIFALAAILLNWRNLTKRSQAVLGLAILLAAALILIPKEKPENALKNAPAISLVGVQLQFPPESLIPRVLDQAYAKHPDANIFVLSEYTLNGGIPDALKNWCRKHQRYLVVGGKDFITNDIYYNTAFVVGTNGGIVFQQAKCVPIQFFNDGRPAREQNVWHSPWGKIGLCVCYDLSYTRVTDKLIRQGAQLLIVPTMDVEYWGRRQHELHALVAPVRAAEYGVPIFRLCSSGISQAVDATGNVIASAPMPGNAAVMAARLRLPARGHLPVDRWLARGCAFATLMLLAGHLFLTGKDRSNRLRTKSSNPE